MSIFNRRVAKFTSKLEDKSILEYFDIPNNNLDITLNRISNYYILYFKYQTKNKFFSFPQLPYEINKIIHNFTQSLIQLEIKVNPSINYPFTYPIYTLYNLKYNLITYIEIPDYYNYLIKTFNEKMINSWTCNIWTEKEVLLLILHFNNFRYFE